MCMWLTLNVIPTLGYATATVSETHLRDVEKDDKDAKPVARHFNLPNHSKQHMAV